MIRNNLFYFLATIAPFTTVAFTSKPYSRPSFTLSAEKKKVFIDGEAGTTGLQVRDRLAGRDDIEIISIPDELRKDEAERKKYINEADAVILCLPDAASIEAASWVESDNDRTVLIDASTAFRVDDSWTYGFPGTFHSFILVPDITNRIPNLTNSMVQNFHRIKKVPYRKVKEFPIQVATQQDSLGLLDLLLMLESFLQAHL